MCLCVSVCARLAALLTARCPEVENLELCIIIVIAAIIGSGADVVVRRLLFQVAGLGVRHVKVLNLRRRGKRNPFVFHASLLLDY